MDTRTNENITRVKAPCGHGVVKLEQNGGGATIIKRKSIVTKIKKSIVMFVLPLHEQNNIAISKIHHLTSYLQRCQRSMA